MVLGSLMLTDFKTIGILRLSALRTGRLYPSEDALGTHLCRRLGRYLSRSAAGRIIPMIPSESEPETFHILTSLRIEFVKYCRLLKK
jgi:hypothetical protein